MVSATHLDETLVADVPLSDIGVEDARLDRVGEIVSSAVKWSAAAGLVPFPVLDLVALGAVQTRMLMDLSAVFDKPFGKEAANSIVSVLLGTLIPGAAAGAVVGSALKTAPMVGTLAGMASMAAFGAAATYAVGKVFARHLAGGGRPGDFSAAAIADDLKAEFKRAKRQPAT
ncbi:DUF697 domain-containing protein [Rhodopseudomonas sp. RCAM05734]|jgi:uncharacterized protein (DUF697 family)|uniref:DUF697 domain-containing protein n=1 Tax=Rhodopseudomonas sp. RCAM05734 TaxID=3457549 RepID=UPI004044BF2C